MKLPTRWRMILRSAAMLTCSILAAPTSAQTPYRFTKIIETTTNGSAFGNISINNHSEVVFSSVYLSGSPTTAGVYKYVNGVVTPMLLSNAYGGQDWQNITNISKVNDNGDIAFTGTDAQYNNGVYLSNGQTTTRLFRSSSGSSSSRISLNNNGRVAFSSDGLLTSVYGIYSADSSGIVRISRPPYTPYGGAVIDDAGNVSYLARDYPLQGIATGNGSTFRSVLDTYADYRWQFGNTPLVSRNGTLVFDARRSASHFGVYRDTPTGIQTVISEQDPMDPTLRSINDQGTLLLYGRTTYQGRYLEGLFTGSNPVQDRVLLRGDLLDGAVVQDLQYQGSDINDQGDIVFSVNLGNGRQALYLAQATPEPGALALTVSAAFSGLLLILRRRRG